MSQDTHPKKAADKWDIQRDPCTRHIMTLHMCPMGPAVQQFLAASSATLRSSASVAPFLPASYEYQCCLQKFRNTTFSKALTFKVSELHSSYLPRVHGFRLKQFDKTCKLSILHMQLECELILSNGVNSKKPACIAEASCSFFCKSSVSSLFFATSSSHNISHLSSCQHTYWIRENLGAVLYIFQINASLLFLQKGDIVSQDTHPKKAADKWDIQRDPCT